MYKLNIGSWTWLAQLTSLSCSPLPWLCCNIPINHSSPLGTHSLEILAFTLLFYGLCLAANGLVCRIFQSRLPLSCNSKQRNINLNRKQRDERWETSQHFLCISSISIRFLLPHLSFAADHIQTSSTFDQCVNQSYLWKCLHGTLYGKHYMHISLETVHKQSLKSRNLKYLENSDFFTIKWFNVSEHFHQTLITKFISKFLKTFVASFLLLKKNNFTLKLF